jgi:hypothetical protein
MNLNDKIVETMIVRTIVKFKKERKRERKVILRKLFLIY